MRIFDVINTLYTTLLN